MKILSVQDISSDFAELCNSLNGEMYKFILFAQHFSFEQEKRGMLTFTFEDFKNIFDLSANPGEKLDGELRSLTYSDACYLVQECLAFREDKFSHIDQDFSEKFLVPRLRQYFDVLSKYHVVPPDQCYSFHAYRGSEFVTEMSWGFCHVFLSEKARSGVLVFACPII